MNVLPGQLPDREPDMSDTVARHSAARRFVIFGVGIDRLNLADCTRAIAGFIEDRHPRQVVTVNPEFVMEARRNPHFRQTLLRADLAVADGIGIVWAAYMFGDRLPGRVGGVDLLEQLARQAAVAGHRLFLLGAQEGVAALAGERLAARHPGLVVAGSFAGSPHPEDEAAICALVNAAHPDLLCVAYGAPAQDLWIARNRARLEVPVAMGVGGAFDYLAGAVPRAPAFVQRLGLEWLYRLARQPWRWRRVLSVLHFGVLVLLMRLRGALQKQG